MLKSLSKYSSTIYAGLLARTALSLTNNISKNQKTIVDNENEIIKSIIDEIAIKYNLDIRNQEHVQFIIDTIDNEIDEMSSNFDDKKVLLKMAEKAELPSDLYEIEIISNIREFYGTKFDLENDRIIKTIKNQEKELHYGLPENDEQPFLISIFSKYFENKYPRNSFTLLVVGQRDKMTIRVHQVWRIYSDVIPNFQVLSLIDLLKAFADVYGMEMELNNERGKFFLANTSNINKTFDIKVMPAFDKNKKPIPTSFTFSHFIQNKPSSLLKQASLLVAIDLNKYKELLIDRKW
jgi:hypothetical protein